MEISVWFAQLCSLFCVVFQGITTYDYVVAMRAMSEAAPEDEEGANIIYSPSNSATTGFSIGSSLGLHHKGAWCTPPRIFIDQVSHMSSSCFQKLAYAMRACYNFKSLLRAQSNKKHNYNVQMSP